MWRSWKLGSAFGIGISVHWSFLLLPALVLLNGWLGGQLALVPLLLVLLLLVFGCVVLHELGHALMARHFGIQTRDITIYPIGGVARLERMSERPWEEFLIALAGPAVNVVIVFVLALLAGLIVGVSALLGVHRSAEEMAASPVLGLLGGLLLCNVVLAVFNLLPIFPMDGGRVLRALLSIPLGRLRATQVAANLALCLAVALAALPMLSSFGLLGETGNSLFRSPMLIVLAGVVVFMGQQELAALRRREAQRQEEALEVQPADLADVPEVLPAGPEEGFTGFLWDTQTRSWVVWQNGRPVGTFGRWTE